MGKLFDANGTPVGGEFSVNAVAAGHQEQPQVAVLPNGTFVVAWTTRATPDNVGVLSFRVFNPDATPLTSEVQIPGNGTLHPKLVDLEPESGGGFNVRWLVKTDGPVAVTSYLQHFTAQGTAVGPAESQP